MAEPRATGKAAREALLRRRAELPAPRERVAEHRAARAEPVVAGRAVQREDPAARAREA
jgi:hypothetical protein